MERNVIWYEEMVRAYQKLVETILPLVLETSGASEVVAYLEAIHTDDDDIVSS